MRDVTPLRLYVSIVVLCGLSAFSTQAWPQEVPAAVETQPVEAASPAPAAGDELSVEQARLADRFKRLEEVIGRLAELSASTDPRRAKLLREAIAQSREQDVNVRFEAVVKLLEEERLSAAATNQTELQKELDALLTLLLKADRDRELSSQRDRIRKYIKEAARLIRMQKGIRARTEGGDELKPLGEEQQRVASDTAKLGGDIAETEVPKENDDAAEEDESANDEGEKKTEKSPDETKKPSDDSKPSEPSKSGEGSNPSEPKEGESQNGESKDGQPSESKPGEGEPSKSQQGEPQPSEGQSESQPSDEGQQGQQPSEPQDPAERAAKRLRAAQQKMEDARKKLDEAERKGAAEQQREALKDLELAKAELERVLRQLREEEMERTLTQLAARFRRMLELQNEVYEGTVRLDRVPEAQRDHDDEIEAARLSRQESQIVQEADKSLLLLHEEGSSVAFPEAVEQMRDDMRQVTKWLADVKVGTLTQTVEQDIIAALEETIAALEKALKDLEKNRMRPGQSSPPGEQGEPELVNKLAELKMIRSLQARIYQRTQRFGEMIEGEQAETAELLEALADLAERQQRVYRATADLRQGRND
jgi:hypothetical protein